jgi:predicted DsbA family dithiol-disulfide isomerase
MADVLFANQRRLFEDNLYQLAERAGVDQEEFRGCMSGHSTRAAVMADTHAGTRLELRSTPTLFINGRRVVGTLPDLDRYEHAILIESRLAEQARRPAASG